jgi:preprotein translocase subunit SecG
METVLLVIHMIIAAALVGVVLLQPAEGNSLSGVGGGGMGGLTTARGAANILTRVTAILVTLFIVTSLTLGIIASHRSEEKSILERVETTQDAAAMTAPAVTIDVSGDTAAVPPVATTPAAPETTAPVEAPTVPMAQ